MSLELFKRISAPITALWSARLHCILCAVILEGMLHTLGCRVSIDFTSETQFEAVLCPETKEPVRVLKNITNAYPVYASNYDAAIDARINVLVASIGVNAHYNKTVVELRQKLDQERSAMQMQLQTAVIGLATTPCDLATRRSFEKLILQINENARLHQLASNVDLVQTQMIAWGLPPELPSLQSSLARLKISGWGINDVQWISPLLKDLSISEINVDETTDLSFPWGLQSASLVLFGTGLATLHFQEPLQKLEITSYLGREIENVSFPNTLRELTLSNQPSLPKGFLYPESLSVLRMPFGVPSANDMRGLPRLLEELELDGVDLEVTATALLDSIRSLNTLKRLTIQPYRPPWPGPESFPANLERLSIEILNPSGEEMSRLVLPTDLKSLKLELTLDSLAGFHFPPHLDSLEILLGEHYSWTHGEVPVELPQSLKFIRISGAIQNISRLKTAISRLPPSATIELYGTKRARERVDDTTLIPQLTLFNLESESVHDFPFLSLATSASTVQVSITEVEYGREVDSLAGLVFSGSVHSISLDLWGITPKTLSNIRFPPSLDSLVLWVPAVSPSVLRGLVLPAGLKCLTIVTEQNLSLETLSIPRSVEVLTLAAQRGFTNFHDLSNLRSLDIEVEDAARLESLIYPDSLRNLTIRFRDRQVISFKRIRLPTTLEGITLFGVERILDLESVPPTLRTLEISKDRQSWYDAN